MIHAQALTRSYGSKKAVDDIEFTVKPGLVTGFLGPNGAGKSTTMRMIVGLDRPTQGSVTVNGKNYAEHKAPMREVGALLDAKAIHTGRSAYNHLLAMGATHRIGKARVQEVILDEPVNGLDPDGVMWVRQLARRLAGEGRTIFLSSHLMSEMALTADHLIVLGRGRIIADAPVAEILAASTRTAVRLRSPHAEHLARLLQGPDVTVTSSEHGLLTVTGLSAMTIGDIAGVAGIHLHELTPTGASLEEAYMDLTRADVEYHARAHSGTETRGQNR
jgi:ABC-2 type transport system ATP-binding protein